MLYVRSIGRPTVSAKVRTLIKQMAQANPLWGAPRIHGELWLMCSSCQKIGRLKHRSPLSSLILAVDSVVWQPHLRSFLPQRLQRAAPGRLVTYREIWQSMQGRKAAYNSSSLRVHLTYQRRILSPYGVSIVHEAGSGYLVKVSPPVKVETTD